MLTERTYDSAVFKIVRNIITICIFIDFIDLNNGIFCDSRN